MNRKGLTLIELVLVIAILGMLALWALPKFFNLSSEAERADRDGVVGAVRSSIALHKANDMVAKGGMWSYPRRLDRNARGVCKSCFDKVLPVGVDDERWTKQSATTYAFDDGKRVYKYMYDSSIGTFTR